MGAPPATASQSCVTCGGGWAGGGARRHSPSPGVPQAEGDHQVGLLLDLVLVNVVVEGVPAAGGRHTQKWVGCGAAMGWLVRCNGMSALVRTC